MTKEEIKQEIHEYISGIDNCIGVDEEFIRGWKCALLVALELIEKLT